MRIQSLHLQNFKRFTDLSIKEIPAAAKLVLLIGANGSGKSCVFDAFDYLGRGIFKSYAFGEMTQTYQYYRKLPDKPVSIDMGLADGRQIGKHDFDLTGDAALAQRFFGRSSIRIVPQIVNSTDTLALQSDRDAPRAYIHNDDRFINDVFAYIKTINTALREPVFRGEQADTLKIFQESIAPLNGSLLNIFGGDARTVIQIAGFEDATPSSPAKLIFRKGQSRINYDVLSHGEKQVVILLLNLIVRRPYYAGAVVFIDEMDCHLNTALQSALLDEIVTRWIPDDSQLWTASHALGFIDYARRSDQAALIDLDNLDFDVPHQLTPAQKDNLEVYEIAIPKATVATILKSYRLVVVENKNDQLFNLALGSAGYLFLPANNNREVFLTVKADSDKRGLRDRDYLRDDEIAQLHRKLPNLYVLPFSTFENLIYHPDNLAEMGWDGFDRGAYVRDITAQKNEQLLNIVAEIRLARTHYIEFKDAIKDDDNINTIIAALKSDDFASFYTFFNMKRFFRRTYLARWNARPSDLAATSWFRAQIESLLSGTHKTTKVP